MENRRFFRHCYFPIFFGQGKTADRIEKVIGDRVVVPTTESPFLREQEWAKGLPTPFDRQQENERCGVGSSYYRFNGGESGMDVYSRVTQFL